MSTALVNAIAEALSPFADGMNWLDEAETAADMCIAVVAAMPADYTAVDVLAALRGEDAPSEPLPAKPLPPEGLLGGDLAAVFDAARARFGGVA